MHQDGTVFISLLINFSWKQVTVLCILFLLTSIYSYIYFPDNFLSLRKSMLTSFENEESDLQRRWKLKVIRSQLNHIHNTLSESLQENFS